MGEGEIKEPLDETRGEQSENLEIKETEPRLKSRIVIIKRQEGPLSKVYVIEGGKKFDLTRYLPKGVKFLPTEHHFSNFRFWNARSMPLLDMPPQASTVEFPLAAVNSRSGRLGILHEMGEAIWEARKDLVGIGGILPEIDSIVRAIIKGDANYKGFKIEKNRQDYLVKKLQERMSHYSISLKGAKYCIEERIHNEKKAWEIALELRQKIIEEKGIDFLDGMLENEISKEINDCLSTYKTYYQNLFPKISFNW